jgi:hypothetical protein
MASPRWVAAASLFAMCTVLKLDDRRDPAEPPRSGPSRPPFEPVAEAPYFERRGERRYVLDALAEPTATSVRAAIESDPRVLGRGDEAHVYAIVLCDVRRVNFQSCCSRPRLNASRQARPYVGEQRMFAG